MRMKQGGKTNAVLLPLLFSTKSESVRESEKGRGKETMRFMQIRETHAFSCYRFVERYKICSPEYFCKSNMNG